MSNKMTLTAGLSAVAVALTIFACNRCGGAASAPESGVKAASSAATPAPAVKGADIKGVIKLEGKAPAASPIKMNADTNCAATADKSQMSDTWVVGKDGQLANAFVYLKEGVDAAKVPALDGSSKVVFDQKGCWYVPHVFGIRVGQTLEIVNDDKTNHNVHAMPSAEADQFNEAQAQGTAAITKKFTTEEIGAHIKCDVHSWMSAYAGVVSHPYFGVSGADGSYTIPNVPPGKYTIHVWHEGDVAEVTGEVTVTEAGAKADFTVKK